MKTFVCPGVIAAGGLGAAPSAQTGILKPAAHRRGVHHHQRELLFVGDGTPDLFDDGTIAYTTLAAGDYLVVAAGDYDTFGGSFTFVPEGLLTSDLVLDANGFEASVTTAEFVDGAALIAFTVAPIAADFDQGGSVNAGNVTLFLETLERGVADFNADGSADAFDTADFLAFFP